jgi:hypothetical protein
MGNQLGKLKISILSQFPKRKDRGFLLENVDDLVTSETHEKKPTERQRQLDQEEGLERGRNLW